MLTPSAFHNPSAHSSPSNSLTHQQDQERSTAIRAAPSYFSNAHNFAVYNPHMYDVETQINNYMTGPSVMKLLSDQTLSGSEFDSSARYPPPQCHPGTRLSIKQQIQRWFDSDNDNINKCDSRRRLLWLYGAAGVGKTAIIQTLAEEIPRHQLGATIFFSRPNKRNNPNRAFTTLAYQLAVKIPAYRDYLKSHIEADPKLLEKSMNEQFKRLIEIPFAEDAIYEGPDTLTIFLDGLDECQGTHQQSKIVGLIANFVSLHPTVPFLWVISSRPEPHLQVAFAAKFPESWQLEVPVDSEEACRDVERYLRGGFDEVRKKYPDSIPSTRWPPESQFVQIATIASGLFVFASTVVKFVDDPAYGDPVSRLERILGAIYRLPPAKPGEHNPLAALDLLYNQIISDIPEDTLPTTKRLLGYLLLSYRGHSMLSYKPKSFVSAANILGLAQNVAYGAVQKLHSVLRIPKPKVASRSPIDFLHASFADYLQDSTRSQSFWVDGDVILEDVCRCWYRVLQEVNGTGFTMPAPSNIYLSWPIDQDEDLKKYLYREAYENWSQALLLKTTGRSLPWTEQKRLDKSENSEPRTPERKERQRLGSIFKQEHTSPNSAYANLGTIPFKADRSLLPECFERFDFLSIADYMYHLGCFIHWIKDESPPEFWNNHLIQPYPLNMLDISHIRADKNAYFIGPEGEGLIPGVKIRCCLESELRIRNGRKVECKLCKSSPLISIYRMLQEFRAAQRQSPYTYVFILGKEPNRCIIFKKDTTEGHTITYIIPYS